jgi:cell division protein FtsN
MRVAIARRPIRGLARPSRGGTFAGLLAGILIGLGTALSVAIFVTKAPVPFLNKATRAPERALDPKTPETAPDPNKPLFSRNRADPSAPAAPEPSILFPGPDRNAPTSAERQASEPEVETTPPSGPSSGMPARAAGGSVGSAQMPPTVLAPAAQAPSPAPNPPARASAPAQGIVAMPPTATSAPAAAPAQAAAPALSASGSSGASGTSAANGASGEGYVLQAGAFRTVEDAEAMRGRLALLGFEARVIGSEVNGLAVQRVRIGPFARMDDMNRARTKLTESGFEVSVVRVR